MLMVNYSFFFKLYEKTEYLCRTIVCDVCFSRIDFYLSMKNSVQLFKMKYATSRGEFSLPHGVQIQTE